MHRVWISNGSQLLRGFETEVVGFETENCQESWLRNLIHHRNEKRARIWNKSGWGSDGGGGARNTHVNIILHSIFSKVEVYINSQQIDNSNGLYVHKSYISNNFKGGISESNGVCTARVKIMKNFLMKSWKRFCLNLFSPGEGNSLGAPMASCCMVWWGWLFLCIWIAKSKFENRAMTR